MQQLAGQLAEGVAATGLIATATAALAGQATGQAQATAALAGQAASAGQGLSTRAITVGLRRRADQVAGALAVDLVGRMARRQDATGRRRVHSIAAGRLGCLRMALDLGHEEARLTAAGRLRHEAAAAALALVGAAEAAAAAGAGTAAAAAVGEGEGTTAIAPVGDPCPAPAPDLALTLALGRALGREARAAGTPAAAAAAQGSAAAAVTAVTAAIAAAAEGRAAAAAAAAAARGVRATHEAGAAATAAAAALPGTMRRAKTMLRSQCRKRTLVQGTQPQLLQQRLMRLQLRTQTKFTQVEVQLYLHLNDAAVLRL